jgi:flagellar biosynthetic protein FlhB
MSDKTEAPTQRRLDEAREEGQVARSLELNTAVIMLVGAFLLKGPGTTLVNAIRDLIISSINTLPTAVINENSLRTRLFSIISTLVPSFGLILVGLLVTGVSITLAQTGFLWAGKKIGFDFKRLNPLTGLQRIFSGSGLIELGRAMLKLVVVGWVAYSYLKSQINALSDLGLMDLTSGVSKWVDLASTLAIRVGSAYLVLAVADYAFQRWRFMRSMRMTKEEIKEDYKRSEGDPFLRGRIRAQQRRLARNRMMSNVPKAKVVITNPTHFAIALDYNPDAMTAPKVLAKGAFHVAQKIVEIAKQNNVPIVQNVPLARALYKSVEVDQEISPDLYLAVAEVLAYVYRLKNPGTQLKTSAA